MLRALFANKLLIGWIAGLVTSAVAGLILAGWIIYGGAYDTNASSPHTRMVAWAAHTTMIHSVKKRAVGTPPHPTSYPLDVLAGAREYEEHCVACHGGPGVARAT
jgi:mono/diheme cytochrome c family protein